MKVVVAFACGVLFAVGLGVSGMLQPTKVIGFLDFFGAWDPTLLAVMVGAIPIYALAWVRQRGRASVWGSSVPKSVNHRLDARLILGASLFGIGWGLTGVCPGPAVTNIAALTPFTIYALASIVAGVALSFLAGPISWTTNGRR